MWKLPRRTISPSHIHLKSLLILRKQKPSKTSRRSSWQLEGQVSSRLASRLGGHGDGRKSQRLRLIMNKTRCNEYSNFYEKQ